MAHVKLHGSNGTPINVTVGGALAVAGERNETLVAFANQHTLTDAIGGLDPVGNANYVGASQDLPRAPIDVSGYTTVTLTVSDNDTTNTSTGYYVLLVDDVGGTTYLFEHAYLYPTVKQNATSRTATHTVNTNGIPGLYLLYDGTIGPGNTVTVSMKVHGHR